MFCAPQNAYFLRSEKSINRVKKWLVTKVGENDWGTGNGSML